MNIFERVKKLIGNGAFANDGTIEQLESYERIAIESNELERLLADPAFKRILNAYKADFKSRLTALIEQDPELKALNAFFERTLGSRVAVEQIEKTLEEFIGEE